MLQNGLATASAEENFVTHKNVDRTQLARLHVRNEAVGLGEGTHQQHSIFRSPPVSEALHLQKPSSTLLTRVRANSRDSRSRAGESSSKKLESSRET